MSKTIQIAGDATGITITNVTRFFAVANTELLAQSTEARAQITYHTAGSLSNLGVRVTARNGSGLCTIRVNVNGVASALSFSVPTSTTGYFEDTDSISIADGDELSYRVGCTLSASVTITAISTTYDATGTTSVRHAFVTSRNFYNVPEEYYGISDGNNSQQLTEATAQFRCATAGTFKNLFIYLSTNSRGGVVVRFRKNGSNGNMVISTPTTTSGIFEDVSNTDSVVVGDLVNYSIDGGATIGGSNTINCDIISCEWVNSDNRFHAVFGNTNTGVAVGTDPDYIPLGSTDDQFGNATEASTQMDINGEFTASKLWVNQVTADGTITLRKNGAATALTTSSDRDVVNSVVLTADDDVCLQITGSQGFYLGGILLSSENIKVHIKGKINILGKTSIL